MNIRDFFTTDNQNLKNEFIKEISANPEEFLPQLFAENNKNSAFALSALSKKTTLVSKHLLEFEKSAENFILSQDPKVRKYGYIIAGNTPSPFCRELLEKSLTSEQTYYTLPSLMLALGDSQELAQKLMDRVQNLKEQIAPKIFNMIVEAYQKVNPPSVCSPTKLNFDTEECLITTQKCYEDILCQSLAFKKQKTKRGIVCKVSYQEFLQLCARRDIYEVLIHAGIFDLENALEGGLKKLSDLVGENKVGYRIYFPDKKLATKFISQAKTLKFDNLINSPSNYSFTISLFVENQVSVYIKAENFKADFSYRTQFLPASINPITANIIASIANCYNQKASAVCDPFCGSSTMLIERFFTKPNIQVFGSDISKEAIAKARENLSNAKIKSNLKVSDIARLNQPCDEIISNLPYGLRVGSHSANAKIYTDLIRFCCKNLTDNGFAFLYTADKKLLRDLIKKSTLKLEQELNFISGGLYCSLFIVKK